MTKVCGTSLVLCASLIKSVALTLRGMQCRPQGSGGARLQVSPDGEAAVGGGCRAVWPA